MRNSEEKKTKLILVIENANFFENFFLFLRLEKVNEQKDKTFSS